MCALHCFFGKGPNGAPRRFPGVGKSVADYFLVLGTNREDPAWGMRPSVLDMFVQQTIKFARLQVVMS